MKILVVDNELLMWIIVISVLLVLWFVAFLREIHFGKKEKLRNKRTVGLVNGRTIAERMLKEAGIENVTIEPQDSNIQRYYYSLKHNKIIISTHACYTSGYYDVMRAATTAANVIQRQEAYGMIDLYLKLAPAMEWVYRVLPRLFFIGIFCVSFNPLLVGTLIIMLWLLVFVLEMLMWRIDRDAAERSCQWLLDRGIVEPENSDTLHEVARYVAHYNLWLVATAGVGFIFARYKRQSDVSV